MKLLVDTHVLIWGLSSPSRLPAEVLRLIRSGDTDSYVSVVSLWEIAIKMKLGKLTAPTDLPQLVEDDPDYETLPILAEHAWRVQSLPRRHGDPFDQLLIAQALVEDLTIVTHDRSIARYGVPVIAV